MYVRPRCSDQGENQNLENIVTHMFEYLLNRSSLLFAVFISKLSIEQRSSLDDSATFIVKKKLLENQEVQEISRWRLSG